MFPPQAIMFFTVDTETFVNTVLLVLFFVLHVRWVVAVARLPQGRKDYQQSTRAAATDINTQFL